MRHIFTPPHSVIDFLTLSSILFSSTLIILFLPCLFSLCVFLIALCLTLRPLLTPLLVACVLSLCLVPFPIPSYRRRLPFIRYTSIAWHHYASCLDSICFLPFWTSLSSSPLSLLSPISHPRTSNVSLVCILFSLIFFPPFPLFLTSFFSRDEGGNHQGNLVCFTEGTLQGFQQRPCEPTLNSFLPFLTWVRMCSYLLPL